MNVPSDASQEMSSAPSSFTKNDYNYYADKEEFVSTSLNVYRN